MLISSRSEYPETLGEEERWRCDSCSGRSSRRIDRARETLTNRTMIGEGGRMIPCICECYEKIPIKRI
jgi:hypothetical protein